MKYWPIILTACLIVSVFPIYVPLHNGLYSDAGGYTVTISLGTPAQQFEVQVDTGSAKLVVGCITCNECRHPHPNFDYTRSSTFQSLSCVSHSSFRTADQRHAIIVESVHKERIVVYWILHIRMEAGLKARWSQISSRCQGLLKASKRILAAPHQKAMTC